mgnify:CR=1 FL=1
MDSGSPVDIAGINTMSQDMKDGIECTNQCLTLETPNGDVVANQVTTVQIDKLGENVEPYALDDSPDVLSIGRRCLKHGYGFHWAMFSKKAIHGTSRWRSSRAKGV